MMVQNSSTFTDSKRHYKILDGLRGVAAIMVVMMHIFETFSGGDHTKMIINHGYLAVDFFFLLSGFVIGYAYDDRWGKMRLRDFFKRRLIRLHPMIVAGMVVGAITFYFQDSPAFPQIGDVPVGKFLLTFFIGLTLLPVPSMLDIRGWQEMHPLNGPAWTLFFEYIANILYAVLIRRFNKLLLSLLVIVAGAALIHLAVTSPAGDLIGGWSLEPPQFRIGITRLLYPFFAGLLLSRVAKLTQINHAFLWCSLLLIIVLSLPRIAPAGALWINGLYDSLCVVIIFPVIVYIGASGDLREGFTARLCSFLGNISYPLYITHYPIMYLYMAWVSKNTEVSPMLVLASVGVLIFVITLAYALLKLYDEPVRKWLASKRS
jgi:peptidoglycan/LPS O-acetylase OafA/YrhL